MTKSQIADLLTDLKREADERNVAMNESFVEQLLVLEREGNERSAGSQKVKHILDQLGRAALTKASEAGDARVGAGAVIQAVARTYYSKGRKGPWDRPDITLEA